MSATPGATNEYSRGNGRSRGRFEPDSGPTWRAGGRHSAALKPGRRRLILGGALAAAVLLITAEFTTLYQAHIATKLVPIQTVTVGSHNSYAMVPIALVAAAFGLAVWRSGNRLALLGVGVLGMVALVIALLHDLPDAHAVGLANNNRVSATTTPGVGLYLETLGAILLIATSGLGFMMLGSPSRHRRVANR